MAFEKVVLRNGEARADYIQRRLAEGAKTHIIMAEINGEALYSGAPGKVWADSVVQIERNKLKAKAAKAQPPAEKQVEADVSRETPAAPKVDPVIISKEDLAAAVVPPEYEGILTPEDVAEVREEAARKIRAKQRKLAKESLLQQASNDLEREARAAQLRGAARGDLVDINIDLAPYAAFIAIDGQLFYHGQMYRVGRSVSKVLQEMMQRSWDHDRSINGQKKDFFQRERFRGPSGQVHDRDPRTGGLRL